MTLDAAVARRLGRIVQLIAIAWLVLLGAVALMWRSWSDSRYVVVALLLFFGPQLAMWVVIYVVLIIRGSPELRSLTVPASDRPIDECSVADTLMKAVAAGSPYWVKVAVDDWLATAGGAEKNGKRADLLDRLYAYAASGHDDLRARSAVNQLRLAINPWVREENRT